MNKIKVGVLGATGAVGQRFVQLLADHPWFEITALCASDRNAGKRYGDACRWNLRGDMPAGPTAPFEPHPAGLATATELVRLVKEAGDFTVGVAAFPDGHPAQFDKDLDARLLLAKEQAGAEFAITQLFFRAESYFDMVQRFRALGGTLPIVAGIMPVTNLGQIQRFTDMAGDIMPADLVRALRAASDDPARLREVGIDWMTRLCDDLLAEGVPGLQFFTLNRSRATSEILARLRQIPPHRA